MSVAQDIFVNTMNNKENDLFNEPNRVMFSVNILQNHASGSSGKHVREKYTPLNPTFI